MIADIPVLNTQLPTISIVRKIEEKPKPVTYQVQKNDSLEKIAREQHTTVSRLFSKNTSISDPNKIEVGQTLVIPLEDETLPERPFPATVEMATQPTIEQTSAPSGRSSISGRFQWGWCTFFADQQRPDIGATGNAADWIRYANSSTPQKGAVAVNTSGLGHVAIVLDFNGSQVLVKHMNWAGFGEVSEDWIDYSYWSGYIL